MGVPGFTDLGKAARDVFKTGYHYGKGLIKCSIKTKPAGSFEMGSDLTLNFEARKLTGSVETRHRVKEYGTLMEKINTDGTFLLGYDINGNLGGNIGLQSEFSYNPETTVKAIKIGAKCANERVNLACSISSDLNSNVNMLGSAVTAFRDLLIGYQAGYNTETNRMTKNDVGLAFGYRNIGFHFRCTSIPHEYGLSLLYKVNDDWDAAVNGILARNGNRQDWTIGAGAKYKIDNSSTLRFKFNTDLQLGTSLQQKLDDNVSLTLSFNVDCANITKGGHKVGLALDIEA